MDSDEYTPCGATLGRDPRFCGRARGHDGIHEATMRTGYLQWHRTREVGELLTADGTPRPAPWTPSGFDLSWQALDAWATAQATRQPCQIILTGLVRREDGTYWYLEEINPRWLEVVQGFGRTPDGRLRAVCEECGMYPGHTRGCSLR